jgi:hypothetical protein
MISRELRESHLPISVFRNERIARRVKFFFVPYIPPMAVTLKTAVMHETIFHNVSKYPRLCLTIENDLVNHGISGREHKDQFEDVYQNTGTTDVFVPTKDFDFMIFNH